MYKYIKYVPPVAAPDMMAFQGSSFFRTAANVQSQQENNVPHIAKLPKVYTHIFRRILFLNVYIGKSKIIKSRNVYYATKNFASNT